jgi:molybdopterin-containing oxidoreductase family iron-sulfur binding subunit
VAGSAAPVLDFPKLADLGSPPPAAPPIEGLELVFRPDPTVWDGRFANNGWLQELPKPLTKLTWDNAALVSLATAEKLGVTNGDVVEIGSKGRRVQAPVLVLPGHAEGSMTLHFGYGRARAGRVAKGAGFDVFALWTSDGLGFVPGASAQPTGENRPLATTQMHRNVDWKLQGEAEKERGLVRVATLAEFQANPRFAHAGEHGQEPPRSQTLYHDDITPKDPIAPDYQWGLVVNLNACTGCGACVLACQAENNIPVVGRDQVLRSREMHWLEIDRYYEGDPASPAVHHQPRMCMHCEKAPCEVVCPVGATMHDHEGLNVMVYNRCVGTRYCSNNCPYKVRHFNFLQYGDLRTPSLALLNNPDVTVRTRGVMEKCTYCIQRISEARQTAEAEGRRIKDGDIVTACQAACPTRAITFGDITDKSSAVSSLKADPRNYGMLAELNTQPRTSYLAKLRNPNPAIIPPPLPEQSAHGV